jgi:asparagine synthase (glutamine-hydrolysing)
VSGILAILGAGREPSRVDAAWERVRHFGGSEAERLDLPEAVLGVARREWQRTEDLAGRSLVVREGDLVVLSDASLYDREGLTAALRARDQAPKGGDPGHLLASAWRAWGPEMVDYLIGDYAFVVHDSASGMSFAARDPMGSRPLYYGTHDQALGLASSSRAVAAWRGSTGQLNLSCLGAQVAGTVLSMGTDTVYAGVHVLRPGFCLMRDGTTRIRRFWTPPSSPASAPAAIADAAPAFRDLLMTAVSDRLGAGTSTVWMSGGWDSTAVFGAGRAGLGARDPNGKSLRPVSIRYPEGDPGYEDPWIDATAARWEAPIEWIESEGVPLLQGFEERAAESDEPPAHLYERWNVALAQGTRRVGGRVALDGCGGDNLFQVSDVVMADALRRGRVPSALRMARARRPLGWRYLVRHALIPLVPEGLLRALSRALRRNVPLHYMEMDRAKWVPERFVRDHGLRERDLAVLNELVGDTHAQSENLAFVTLPALAWGGAYMRGVLLREGVEARSPLLDPRVIDFALRRPVADRVSEAETKILLRTAVKGWVPDEVLASRRFRTGVTSGYSRRRMAESYPALLDRLFSQSLRVADLGIVDPTALRMAADDWRAGRGDHFRTELFNTMRVEFWLRGQDRG